ncbi:Transketolase [Granulibacter bethesdensis]|nr:Transketolase [Granulibacter bethesdensis]
MMDTHHPDTRDTVAINTIRTLAMDAVQKANSGHPGTPMSMAPVAYTLWQNHLNFDPADPIWPNRDRFVLSIGHASMLLYALLHLTGTEAVDNKYNTSGQKAVTLQDIEQFRQMSSKTPGHPEYHHTSGVETTTGPLGQGVANSVGMAIAEKYLAARYNRPGYTLFDYNIYAMCGDGDMMEGVSGEAASLAGHLKLDNLVWIYDSNHITIEGRTNLAFGEDVAARFAAYGWDVHTLDDANDTAKLDALLSHIRSAKTGKPAFILVHSIIGWGAPHKQDTHEAHGSPLGDEEIKLAKKFYGWPEDAKFLVPDGVYETFANGISARSARLNKEWQALFARYRSEYPDLASEIDQIEKRTLPEGWDKDIPVFEADAKGIATRQSSGKVLNAVAKHIPWLLGGSADLAPSTNTLLTFTDAAGENAGGSFSAENRLGRNFHWGIREHAMGSAINGMALSKLRPYGSGFLIFSDYMRAPIRLASLMEIPAIWIFTHDSIGVGEDGPTHQPVEQLISLRSIPGNIVIRPADANEVAEAWRTLIPFQHQPVCLILSRQALPTVDRSKYASASGVARGGYILADTDGAPDVILIGTGSEVQHCIAAHETLAQEGIKARVVSLPSWELFERQDQSYRDNVLPPSIKARVTIEQGATFGWERYAGSEGTVIGMHTFGASAPLAELLKHFGFTPHAVAEAAREQVKKHAKAR